MIDIPSSSITEETPPSKIPSFPNLESKLLDYCKKAKKETEENFKFLLLKNKSYEESIKQNIETCYDHIVKLYIETILKNDLSSPNLFDNWYEKTVDLVKQAIAKVSPSYRDLGDSSNINEFIKIKTIKYKNQSLCKLIDGFAFRKNVSSKKMRFSIDNPKLLLLNCGLDVNVNEQTNTASHLYSHSNNNTSHEKEFTEMIQKKFEAIGVDIVLLNQNVSHYMQKELLDKNNITLVLNVKSKSLKNIARCTKTSLFNNVNIVNNNSMLGQCKKFRIEKYKSFSSSSNNINTYIKANEYNLMIFEGCDNLLFQTIVISGPNENELKKLKELLKYSILLTVRDFYLQKNLLYFLYCDIPKRISTINKRKVLTVASIAGFNKENSNNAEKGNGEESPRGKDMFLAMKKSASVNGEDLVYKYGFDTQVLFEKFSEINFIKLTMCRGIKKQFNINQIPTDNRTTMGVPGLLIDTSKKQQHNNINHDNVIESSTLLMPSSPQLYNKNSYIYDNITLTPDLCIDISGKPSLPSIPNFELLTNSPFYSYLSAQIPQIPNTSETNLLKNLNVACGEPEDIKLIHYSMDDKYDKPLGKLIIELCYEKDQKCEKCKRVKSLHFYYLYSVNSYSRIKIAFILDNSQFKLDKIYEYINREGSVDFRKYSNIPTTTTISQTNLFTTTLNNNIDYSLDIFSYGYCRTCNEIVTPLCKIPRDIFNYSSSKFFKHILLNHDIKNRSDNMNFNLSNFFAKNTCNHSSFKCLDRIFVTKIGALSFSYESIIRYFIEPRFLMYNDVSKNDIVNSCETFITNYQTKCIEVFDAINANLIYANDELIAMKKIISDKKGVMSINSFNYFVSVIDKVEKEINRLVTLLPEQKKNLVSCIFSHKYDRLNKCVFYVKKLLFRITQVKIIHNKIRKEIIKIKQYIMLDLYYNLDDGNTSKNSNDEDGGVNNNEYNQQHNNGNNTNGNNNNLNSNIIGGTNNNNNSNDLIIKEINAKFSKIFPTVNYISIDSKQSYIDIIKSLNYYDEKHISCISEIIQETDISSIIAYTLTSDQYRNHVNQSGKYPLLDIICERYNNNTTNISNNNNNNNFNTTKQSLSTIVFCGLTQDNFFLSNTNNNVHINNNNNNNVLSSKLQSDFIEMNSFLNFNNNNTHFHENLFEINNSHLHNTTSNNTKYGYSYNSFSNNQNSQILYDTMLLFDSSKNIYRDKETHKTNKELEMELISDDKSHFVYSMSSLNNKIFKIGTLSRKLTMSSRQGLSSNSSRHEKTPYDTLEDKLNSFEEDIQKGFDNLNMIRIDMKELKNNNSHIQRNYSQIKKLHFIEDNFHSSQIDVIVYFPKQFEALRITYFCSFDDLIYSLTRFTKWKSNSGGKSKALFFKSQDNKLLFKSVSKQEFKMFIDTAGQYFHHNARYLFHKMPSALAKVLGAFKIKIRHQTKEKYYLLLMENVFYGIDKKNPFTKTYDLKGSLINRYITKTQMKKQEVLLDSNFKEDFNGEPIVLDRSVYELLNLAVHNDTFFLSSINVIDYSLLVVMSDIGELDSRLLKVGIIDYSRQYTWDKKLEHVVKLIINGLNNPTIISPNNYRDRFNSAIASYFIGV